MAPPKSSTTSTTAADKSVKGAQAKKTSRQLLNYSDPKPVVAIAVDREQQRKRFFVPKCLICYYSPFFNAGFNNSNFIEGQTQEMNLEDVDSKVFGFLVHWVFTRNLDPIEELEQSQILMLLKVWMLANRFIMFELQNKAVEMIFGLLGAVRIEHDSMLEAILYIYENDVPQGPNGSPLRDLFAKHCAFKLGIGGPSLNCWDEPDARLPRAFLEDMLKILGDFHDRQPAKFHGKRPHLEHLFVGDQDEAFLE